MKVRHCYYTDCSKRFSSKYNLARHVNTHHLQIRKYYCPRCSRVFPSKQNLGLHEKSSTCSRTKPLKALRPKQVEFLLSNHYTEPKESSRFIQTKVLIPALPPVDLDRRNSQGDLKLPTLPLLINPVKQ